MKKIGSNFSFISIPLIFSALLLVIFSGTPVNAVRCFECVGVEGLQGFNQDCITIPNKTQAITSEACVRAEGVYKNLPAVVRVGIYRLSKNDPVTCEGQRLALRVNGTVLENLKYCHICLEQDGCNGALSTVALSSSSQTLFYFGLIAASYFYNCVYL